MGRTIIKINDKYFIWSSVVDAPVSKGLTAIEMNQKIENNEVRYLHPETAEELNNYNRAGKNESKITLQEIYEEYN